MIIKTPTAEQRREQLRTNTRIPRAKFAIAAAKAGLITEAEAEEWAAGAAVPQWVSDALEAAVTAGAIPEEERLEVRIAVRTQDTIGRMDRLIPILADSKGLTGCPEWFLVIYAALFSILNTLHNWFIMTLVFREFPKEFFTTKRLKRLKVSDDPKKRELADMLGGFLNRQDKGHY